MLSKSCSLSSGSQTNKPATVTQESTTTMRHRTPSVVPDVLPQRKLFCRVKKKSSNYWKNPLLPLVSTTPSSKAQLPRRSSSYASSSSTAATSPLSLASSSSSSLSEEQDHARIPAHAYVTLASAVLGLSAIGPSLDLQQGVVSPTLKIYWRMTGTYLVLAPLAFASIYRWGWPKLSLRQSCTFITASACYAVMCIGFVISLDYTSVGNAVIFSNTHALLLLSGRFLVGSPVSVWEGAGALIAFAGGVCCTVDASGESSPTEPPAIADTPPIWQGCLGDLIALVSALGGTLYLVLAKTVRARFPSPFVFVFMNMMIASTITFIYMHLMGHEFSYNQDIHSGLWGFLHSRYDRLPLELFMVVVCNMTGSMGYLRSTQYFDNLAISVATLMEPVSASFLGFAVGVGSLPGALGWLGNALVALGTVTVIYPRPKNNKDSAEASCGILAFSMQKLKQWKN